MGLGDLTLIAHNQHGLFSRGQAREAGVDRNRLRRLVRDGLLEQTSPRVFRFAGSSPSPFVGVLTGVLDAGTDAVVSHLTAARLWGVKNLPAQPIHVTIPRTDRVRGETVATVHQATRLPDDLVTVLHDVPIVVPAMAVLQVAAFAPGRAGHVLDTLWAKRILRISEVTDVHDRFSRQGNEGVVRVRRLLKHRSDDMRPAESGNERRFERIAWEGGILTLRRQVDVGGGAWIGRVDYLDSVVPLIVEVHSERYHSSYLARQADADRIRQLEKAGFTVVVVWDHEIWGDPGLVLDRIRDARARLLATTA